MITMEQVERLLFAPADVVGEDGKKIGTTGQVFLDAQSGDPAWVTVRTGLFGSAESFVPLADAHSDGDAIRVPYRKDLVKHAPRIESADGSLSPDEERELYRHYGLLHDDVGHEPGDEPAGEVGTRVAAPAPPPSPAAGPVAYVDDATPASGAEADRPGDDRRGDQDRPGDDDQDHGPVAPGADGMLVQEERLRVVATERVPTERVRLKRYTVTEMRDVTVPVSREEVRVEYEPVGDVRDDDGPAGDIRPVPATGTTPPDPQGPPAPPGAGRHRR